MAIAAMQDGGYIVDATGDAQRPRVRPRRAVDDGKRMQLVALISDDAASPNLHRRTRRIDELMDMQRGYQPFIAPMVLVGVCVLTWSMNSCSRGAGMLHDIVTAASRSSPPTDFVDYYVVDALVFGNPIPYHGGPVHKQVL